MRISGFRRENSFGPDEIGALVARHGIAWNDGLGNGMLESLYIDRKHGFSHTLEAPYIGFPLPFLDAEARGFAKMYAGRVSRMMQRLKELERVYGRPLAGQANGMCTSPRLASRRYCCSPTPAREIS